MLSNLAVLLLAAAAPLASAAVGRAKVVNNCAETVYVWPVGGTVEGPYALSGTVGYYAEQFRKDPVSGGRALKVARTADGLYTGAAQTVFAYNLDSPGDKVWYDLSDVFGDAFAGKKLVVQSDEPSCQSIIWPNGVPPAGSQVKNCRSDKDVTLTLCAP